MPPRQIRIPPKTCPSNPVFYSWVRALRDQAKEDNTQAHHTYSRALRALSQYPLPLRSGQEARIIKNIGDKMAKILDKKCVEYYQERGYRDTEIEFFMTGCPFEKLPTVKEKLREEMMGKGTRKRKKHNSPQRDPAPPPSKQHTKSRKEMDKDMLADQPGVAAADQQGASNSHQHHAPTKTEDVARCSNADVAEIEEFLVRMVSKGNGSSGPPAAGSSVRVIPPAPPATDTDEDVVILSPIHHTTNMSPRDLLSANHSTAYKPRDASPGVDSDGTELELPAFGDVISITEEPTYQPGVFSANHSTAHRSRDMFYYSYVKESGADTRWRSDAALMDSGDMTGLWMLVKVYRDSVEQCGKIYLGCVDKVCTDPRFTYIYLESSECALRAPGLPSDNTSPLSQPSCSRDVPGSPRSPRSADQSPSPCRTTSPPPSPTTNYCSPPANYSSPPPGRLSSPQAPSNSPQLPDISDSDSDDIVMIRNLPAPVTAPLVIDHDRLTQIIQTGLKSPFSRTSQYKTQYHNNNNNNNDQNNNNKELKVLKKKSSKGKEPARSKTTVSPDYATKTTVWTVGSDKPGSVVEETGSHCNRSTGPVPVPGKGPVVQQTGRCDDAVSPAVSPAVPPAVAPVYTLRANTYRILLCVDNAEVNTLKQQQLLQELDKNGVLYDVRKLQVGDFVWVAQDTCCYDSNTARDTDTDTTKELVLDVVVERKRMDDLASSITGGRFAEQKLRLKTCGLSKRVYLVETKKSYISLPEKTLNQAVVNTQVIDNFTIKKTRNLKETAAYLTLLTKYLTNKYTDTALVGVAEPSQTSQTSLLTFPAFSDNSVKNRVFTVKETFLKQLARIPKISQDKAEAIVQVFPTPLSLLSQLDKAPEHGDGIVEHVKFGPSRRKIGIAASRSVAALYNTTGKLS